MTAVRVMAPGTQLTVTVTVETPLQPIWSIAVTVVVNVPETVGALLQAPLGDKLKPVGWPEAVKVYVPVPPRPAAKVFTGWPITRVVLSPGLTTICELTATEAEAVFVQPFPSVPVTE